MFLLRGETGKITKRTDEKIKVAERLCANLFHSNVRSLSSLGKVAGFPRIQY